MSIHRLVSTNSRCLLWVNESQCFTYLIYEVPDSNNRVSLVSKRGIYAEILYIASYCLCCMVGLHQLHPRWGIHFPNRYVHPSNAAGLSQVSSFLKSYFTFSCFLSPAAYSGFGFWNIETLEPWRMSGVGLWLILYIAAIVNNYCCRTGGQTAQSSIYRESIVSPN